ncbi:MAG: (2Fe-2S) ferredoxin domain-containing protein [Clostridia bacterium]|nr:(2Fe-2S) ferredoxin domain-containing protein [Clostridia bacterium]
MKTLAELQAIRDRQKMQMASRSGDDEGKIKVVVGMATCGIAAGARPVLNTIIEEVENRRLTNVQVTQTGCIGMCKLEPLVDVIVPGKEKVTYVHVTPEKARAIVSGHIVNGQVVTEYTVAGEKA